MKTLTFHNETVLDPKAFRFMGLSVKQDNSFGMFGTGLKYAIATLLRLGDSIKIVSGGKTFNFTLAKMDFRGKEFASVQCNGEDLGFTTELGKMWEGWMAYRELYCNARDEGGDVVTGSQVATTQVIVTGDILAAVHAERHQWFIDVDRKPIWEDNDLRIFSGESSSYFYQGVNVGEFRDVCPFTIDFKSGISLSEDRLDKWPTLTPDRLGRRLRECDDEFILNKFIGLRASDFGQAVDYSGSRALSKTFASIASDVFKATRRIPNGIKEDLVALDSSILDLEVVSLSDREKRMLRKATRLLKQAGYDISPFPVKKISAEGINLLGQAKDMKEIHLTEEAFERGMFDFVATLLEEFAHCHTKHFDMTREFQQWLFNQLVRQMEERFDEVL